MSTPRWDPDERGHGVAAGLDLLGHELDGAVFVVRIGCPPG